MEKLFVGHGLWQDPVSYQVSQAPLLIPTSLLVSMISKLSCSPLHLQQSCCDNKFPETWLVMQSITFRPHPRLHTFHYKTTIMVFFLTKRSYPYRNLPSIKVKRLYSCLLFKIVYFISFCSFIHSFNKDIFSTHYVRHYARLWGKKMKFL